MTKRKHKIDRGRCLHCNAALRVERLVCDSCYGRWLIMHDEAPPFAGWGVDKRFAWPTQEQFAEAFELEFGEPLAA